MINLWARLSDACSIVGIPHALALSIQWFHRRRFEFFSFELARFQPDPLPAANLNWSFLEPGETAELSRINPLLGFEKINRRLESGMRCRLGRKGDSIVHYRWECAQACRLEYLDLQYRPQPGELVSVEVFTVPDSRRSGIHKAATFWAAQQAKNQGFTRFSAFVADWNRPTQQIWRQGFGISPLGHIIYRPYSPKRRHKPGGRLKWDSPGSLALKQ